MGEVYRAKDTRLGRDVAVKILPAHLSQNTEVRERFEREARAISSLNHPHICTLYDIGRDGDADYFVMELLDGEPLSARLDRGPMKPDEALRIGAQVADGLAAAHRQGIVHRDLKPGNVVLTKSGAKILDFGVAKLREEQVVDMATRTTPLTTAGAMIGTVQYMAPEQLEGKPVDHRADLFALGALLFEMITGQRAFAGQSQASVIAAILTSEPRPVSELVPGAPPALDRVVKSCLAKDPDQRWQSAGDLARELRWIADGKAPAIAPSQRRAMTGRELIAWGIAGIFFAAAILMAVRPRSGSAAPMPTTRFSVAPANGQVDGAPVFSPDGRSIVFVLGPDAGKSSLWLHSLDSGLSRSLPGTEEARQPFWSPDGKSIAFFAQGRLKTMSLAGEPPIRICDAADARGGSWGSGGDIIFCPNSASGLFRVAAIGGTPTVLTKYASETGQQSHRMPSFLPDGRHFLYTATGSSEHSGIYWASLDGADTKRVLPDVSSARYDERGYIVFRRAGTLMTQRFNAKTGETSGDAVVLASDVGTDPQLTAFDQFSISRRGALAFRTGASQQMRLTWTDRAGKPLGLAAPDHSLFEPSLSRDETKLTAGGTLAAGGDGAVWVVDLQAGGQISRLTFGKREPETPAWSADGKFLYFTQAGSDGWAIVRKAADGTGTEETLIQTKRPTWGDSASPDGRYLVLEQYEAESGGDLWLLSLDGEHTLTPYRKTPGNETHAMFSTDGRYLAYSSDEQGGSEIFVETVPPSGSRWQVSSGGGEQAAWRSDGKALYYVNANRMLVEVDIKSTVPFVLGSQRQLFQLPIPTVSLTGPRTYYAVTRDGQKILVNALAGREGTRDFQVVLNWDTPLRAK